MDGNELPNGSDLDTLKQYVDSTITSFSNNLYPTGSIYITIDKAFNPNNNPIFGTGWVKLPDGYFLSTASNPLINNTQSLPNIKGAMIADDQVVSESNELFDSAFSFTERSSTYDCKSDLSSSGGTMLFDASRWCSVYQDTINIKPKSLDVVVWRKGGSILQNNASYTMKTEFNKYNLLLAAGSMNCHDFVITMHQIMGSYSTYTFKKPASFNFDGRTSEYPAGDFIKTTVSSGVKAVLFGKESYHTYLDKERLYVLTIPSSNRVVDITTGSNPSTRYTIKYSNIYV